MERLIDHGVHERAPEPGIHYVAFTDEAGGSGSDASTLSIVHLDNQRQVIQDLIRIWRPPFSPQEVIGQKAALLKTYGITRVTGDRWAGGIPPDLYRANGIRFEPSGRVKSDIYIDFLALLNSARIRLLDNEQQIAELLNLERRVRWGGRESIDHPQSNNFHDDAINATAGAAVLASAKRGIVITPDLLAKLSVPKDWRGNRAAVP